VDNNEKLLYEIKENLERGFADVLGSVRETLREGFAQLNAKFDEQEAKWDAVEADPEFIAWVERMKKFKQGPE
jgi:hypothetical protein